MKPSGLLYSVRGGVAPKLIDYIYPLGTVLTFTKDVDPNDIYTHQTWERFAKGKTLVGVDEGDTDFASVGNTGGEKTHTLTSSEMPSHAHSISTDSHYVLGSVGAITRHSCASGSGHTNILKSASSTVDRMWKGTINAGGSGAHNNLQPYETVYYWKRTA